MNESKAQVPSAQALRQTCARWVGLGSEAGKQGVKSVVGTGIAPTGVPQMQNYTQPIDNTRVEQPIYPLLELK